MHKETVDLHSKERKSNHRGSMEKSSKKLSLHGSKAAPGNTHASSTALGKDKKGTPLKKNLDKYYF